MYTCESFTLAVSYELGMWLLATKGIHAPCLQETSVANTLQTDPVLRAPISPFSSPVPSGLTCDLHWSPAFNAPTASSIVLL